MTIMSDRGCPQCYIENDADWIQTQQSYYEWSAKSAMSKKGKMEEMYCEFDIFNIPNFLWKQKLYAICIG